MEESKRLASERVYIEKPEMIVPLKPLEINIPMNKEVKKEEMKQNDVSIHPAIFAMCAMVIGFGLY
jgi:hypothetical protein